MSWFHFWLSLHVTAAIVAFGPTFVFPLIGSMMAKNPMHANFALRVDEAIEDRLVIPFALTMPVSGLAMAWIVHVQWEHNPWLIAALVLYTTALTIAIFMQRPAIHKLIEMTSHAPAGAQPGAAPVPAAVGAGPGAQVAGPPPEMLRIINGVKMRGMLLTLLLLSIIVLMVWKPGGNI